ncbi:hypothetical protein Droror1_Dr00001302 [Drosera rotundifolia]
MTHSPHTARTFFKADLKNPKRMQPRTLIMALLKSSYRNQTSQSQNPQTLTTISPSLNQSNNTPSFPLKSKQRSRNSVDDNDGDRILVETEKKKGSKREIENEHRRMRFILG